MKNRFMIWTLGTIILANMVLFVQPVLAMPKWVSGTVTAKPWVKKYRHIEVDGRIYTLMPDIRISSEYQDRPGAWAERQTRFSRIRKGMKIMMRVEGSRVYQILLYK